MITAEDIEAFQEEIESSRKPPLTVTQMVEIFATTMRQVTDPEMSAGFIKEEYQEWRQALLYEPDAEELKEMADLVYVLYGYARARGWDLDEAVRRVHKNNLDRCIQPDGSIQYRADGKVLKRDNPPKIDLEDLV